MPIEKRIVKEDRLMRSFGVNPGVDQEQSLRGSAEVREFLNISL